MGPGGSKNRHGNFIGTEKEMQQHGSENQKQQLWYCATSLRQHGFLVVVMNSSFFSVSIFFQANTRSCEETTVLIHVCTCTDGCIHLE